MIKPALAGFATDSEHLQHPTYHFFLAKVRLSTRWTFTKYVNKMYLVVSSFNYYPVSICFKFWKEVCLEVWVKSSEMPAGQWSMVGLQIWWRSLHASAVCTPPMHGCITPPSCISLYECLVTLLVVLLYFTFMVDWAWMCISVIHRLMLLLVFWLLLMPFKYPPAVQFHCIIWWHLKCTAFLNPPPYCSLCIREVWGLFSTSFTVTGPFELKLSTLY